MNDPTRTSEALSDVEWLREFASISGAKTRLLAIATAYADLSHLCANYKAKSERLTTLHTDLQALASNELLNCRDEKWRLQERIRQLEALLSEARCPRCAANASYRLLEPDAQPCQWCDERSKALAVPQEGNK